MWSYKSEFEYFLSLGLEKWEIECILNINAKKVFVLGVYASAVHARWKKDGKVICQALAVASEPRIFWDGNPEEAKRIIDFLSGCIYAIGGTMQKVGVGIYLCAPKNVNVQGKITEDNDKGKSVKENEEDIDKYLAELREKLIEKLNGHDVLHII